MSTIEPKYCTRRRFKRHIVHIVVADVHPGPLAKLLFRSKVQRNVKFLMFNKPSWALVTCERGERPFLRSISERLNAQLTEFWLRDINRRLLKETRATTYASSL